MYRKLSFIACGIEQPQYWRAIDHLRERDIVSSLVICREETWSARAANCESSQWLEHFELARANIGVLEDQGIPITTLPLLLDYQEEYSEEIRLVAANCLERSSRGNSYSDFELSYTVDNYFLIAESLIAYFQPDFVLFEVAPHLMYDLALYLTAKRHGIKVFFVQDTHIELNCFLASDAMSPKPVGKTSNRSGEEERSANFECQTTQQLFTAPWYMGGPKQRKISFRFARAILSTMIQGFRSGSRQSYAKKKNQHLWSRKVSLIALFNEYFEDVRVGKFYRGRITNVKDLPERFFYVPLSLQHERTTMPQASFNYQQFRYIRYLAAKFGDSYAIVIKENPKQFGYSISSGTQRRSRQFYQDLLDLGCVFCDTTVPTEALIQLSKAVAVTTGSAGFEAVVNFGRPALLFSGNWYDSMPGTTILRRDLGPQSGFESWQPHQTELLAAWLRNLDEQLFFFDPNKVVETEIEAMALNLTDALVSSLGRMD